MHFNILNIKYFTIISFLIVVQMVFCQTKTSPTWQSSLVSVDTNEKITYFADEEGNTLPDFSRVGYHHGDKSIPCYPVIRTIKPVEGDNWENIQRVINEISNNEPDVHGQVNGWLRANVNSSSEVNRYLNRSFGDPELSTPFSIRARLGFESNAPTLETIKVGNKTGNTMLEYQLNCLKDPASETGFVNRISFSWYPTNVTPGFPVVPVGGISPDGSTTYNSKVSIQTRNTLGLTTTQDYYYTISKMSTFTNKNYKKVGMAVDENYQLHVFMEGEEVLTTPVISELRTLNQMQGGIFIDNWRVIFPNGNGGANRPMLYFDDAYASTTELLK